MKSWWDSLKDLIDNAPIVTEKIVKLEYEVVRLHKQMLDLENRLKRAEEQINGVD